MDYHGRDSGPTQEQEVFEKGYDQALEEIVSELIDRGWLQAAREIQRKFEKEPRDGRR